jgi:hypothetical protein
MGIRASSHGLDILHNVERLVNNKSEIDTWELFSATGNSVKPINQTTGNCH